jgi:valyl-tRNA synthetase
MSKSKGNIIDPLDVMAKYGTDALRFALVYANSGGTDMAFAEERIRGMKHFANKIWNIFRFIDISTSSKNKKAAKPVRSITDADKKILKELDNTINCVTKHLENFRFNEAAQSIYEFLWHEFADKYLEASKIQLKDAKISKNTENLLIYCFRQSLKILHPFMPFITEYIWEFFQNDSILAIEKWPKD